MTDLSQTEERIGTLADKFERAFNIAFDEARKLADSDSRRKSRYYTYITFNRRYDAFNVLTFKPTCLKRNPGRIIVDIDYNPVGAKWYSDEELRKDALRRAIILLQWRAETPEMYVRVNDDDGESYKEREVKEIFRRILLGRYWATK